MFLYCQRHFLFLNVNDSTETRSQFRLGKFPTFSAWQKFPEVSLCLAAYAAILFQISTQKSEAVKAQNIFPKMKRSTSICR